MSIDTIIGILGLVLSVVSITLAIAKDWDDPRIQSALKLLGAIGIGFAFGSFMAWLEGWSSILIIISGVIFGIITLIIESQ